MQYDLTTVAGLLAFTTLVVQGFKGSPLSKHVPIWLVVVVCSGLLIWICRATGVIPADAKASALVAQVMLNALASSGAFTWATGQAGLRPSRSRKKRSE